jgi:hypothetical protein
MSVCLGCTIHNSKDTESTETSISGWMYKENEALKHNGVLLSHKSLSYHLQMDGNGGHNIKWNESDIDKYFIASLICGY